MLLFKNKKKIKNKNAQVFFHIYLQTIKAENKAFEQNVSFRDNPTFVVLDVNEAGKQGKDHVDNKSSSPSGKTPTKGREIVNSSRETSHSFCKETSARERSCG